MCESGARKRRRDNTREAIKTVKGIFKKDDLDDSLSVSDWGFMIEDEHKSRRRDRSVKLDEEPLTLTCEWNSCYQIFSEFVLYNNHLNQHLEGIDVDNGELNCCWINCIYITNSFLDLKRHLCFHGYHTKLKSVGKNVEYRAKLPKCTQSDYFVFPVDLYDYNCEWEYCNMKFETIFDFFEHIRVHVYHNPKGCKEGTINCCWKGCTSSGKFISQYKLSEHMRIHTKEKIIACPTCGNLFSNKTKFCDHRRRQLPINLQSYLCSQCSKYFPSERLLRDHMRLHINHYKCSMCEMTCPKPSILAKHIRYRHLNEKPYKCVHCDYRCVSKQNLDFHIKKHDPSSHFECSECNFKCRSSFGLDRHYQKSHGKDLNVYECHNCKKRFIRGSLLTKHLMKVHNYHWPSGHSRFRYKEDQDGIYRLQTVRYETLDVTEEIIKGNTIQAPSERETVKFDVLKRREDDNALCTFDVVISKGIEQEKVSDNEARKKVVITIDDIDAKGNVVKTQTIQSREILCDDMKQIVDDINDKIILVQSDKISNSTTII